jgi:hypothetical protein
MILGGVFFPRKYNQLRLLKVISGSYRSEYEDVSLLGYGAMQPRMIVGDYTAPSSRRLLFSATLLTDLENTSS